MKECKIVEDLLPLYAEELVGSETKEFIDTHCAACESCARLKARAEEVIPEQLTEPETVKKALRGNTLKMVFMGIGIFAVAIVLIYFGATKLDDYMKWKGGRAPVEQVIKAPVGNGEVTLVDWEASGWRIGGIDNVGTAIWYKQMDVREYEHGTGYSINEGAYTEPWENVQVYWSPDGMTFLVTADLLEGRNGIYVHAHKSWYDEDGGHHSVSQFLPSAAGNGFVNVLTALCKEQETIPTGWETIEFTFHQWQEDSETITFVYETDTGNRGLLDFHYPTETITKVN